MSVYDFNQLILNERIRYILANGVYLCHKIEGRVRYNLYAVFNFYAEIEFNFTDRSMVSVRTFKSGGSLDEYLKNVNIDNILQNN